jgi:hypothetical protein
MESKKIRGFVMPYVGKDTSFAQLTRLRNKIKSRSIKLNEIMKGKSERNSILNFCRYNQLSFIKNYYKITLAIVLNNYSIVTLIMVIFVEV